MMNLNHPVLFQCISHLYRNGKKMLTVIKNKPFKEMIMGVRKKELKSKIICEKILFHIAKVG